MRGVEISALTRPPSTGNRPPATDLQPLPSLSSPLSDAEYTALVTALDERIKAIDGTGFVTTPLMYSDELQAFIKNESGQVAGSHKARHLFNVMIYLQVWRPR